MGCCRAPGAARAWIATCALLASACGAGDDGDGRCELGNEHVVGETGGNQFDGIALVASGDGGAIAVWSAHEGTFARALSRDGAPSGEARRIDARCDGGVAAVRDRGEIVVACLRRGQDAAQKKGGVVVLRATPDGRVRSRRFLEGAGPESRGIDVALFERRPVVVWQSASPAQQEIWLAELGRGDEPPRVVSSPGALVASGPSLFADEERFLVTWAEGWSGAGRAFEGHTLVHDGRGAPREVAPLSFGDARPSLVRDARSLILAFRDERPPGTRSGLYLQRVGRQLRPIGEPVRVGRANGEGGPSVLACEHALVTVAPRTFGRWDVLVGINRIDPERFEKRELERQVYEYGSDFALARGACRDDGALLLVAERGTTTRPTARVRAMPLACRRAAQRTSRPPAKR